MIGEQRLSADDAVASTWPRLAPDNQDRLHLVWSDEDAGDVRYLQLTSAGTIALPERVIFTGGDFRFRSLPVVAADAAGGLHIVLNEQRDTASAELFYLLLDAATGAVRIDATVITIDDSYLARYPSIGVDAQGLVTVVFQDQRLFDSGGEIEIFSRRLDPSRDDQNGDCADPDLLVIGERLVSTDDGNRNNHPAATIDTAGNLFASYYDSFSGQGGRGDLLFQLRDASGHILIPEQQLTTGRTATTTDSITLAFTATHGLTAYLVWTDDASGNPEVVLQVLNPDVDGDGLSGLEEWLQGTDYRDPDTDGGGRSDGQEVLEDGTDPLNGADDLP